MMLTPRDAALVVKQMPLPVMTHSFNLDAKYKMNNGMNVVVDDSHKPYISCNCSRRKLRENVNASHNDDFMWGKQKARVSS